MRDNSFDLIIGEEDYGNTWTSISYNSRISENTKTYSIRPDIEFLDIKVCIFKNTEEGKYIANLISQAPNDHVEVLLYSYVLSLALRDMSLSQICTKIREYGDRKYIEGKNDLRNQIKDLLHHE